MDALTHRQERFVFEYLKDQNASAAACAGYSAESRASQASELMQRGSGEGRAPWRAQQPSCSVVVRTTIRHRNIIRRGRDDRSFYAIGTRAFSLGE
ncbi:MAG: Terminase small subunit [Betaproteobacteria bacterium]|nr:Terminase small subunit [Betaproteobacteria bacterium]